VIYQFYDGVTAPPTSGNNGTANCVVGQIWKPGYNGNINALLFYKGASDTGTHTAFVFRESDQALLGSQAFTGETASGWQTCTFSSPIAVLANTNYRIAVSHVTGNWPYMTGGATAYPNMGSVMSVLNGCYALSSQTAYPNNTSGDSYLIDVQFDGPVITPQVRVSQAAIEPWYAPPGPAVRVSQAMLEAMVLNTPIVRTSQVFAEVWMPSGFFVVASQLLAEVWSTDLGFLAVSQVTDEVWSTDVASVAVSQVVAEAWLRISPFPPPAVRRYQEMQHST